MNNSISNWLAVIATAIVGILFIVWHNELSLFNWLVTALGIALVIPGTYIMFGAAFNIRRRIKHRQSATTAKRSRTALAALLIVSAASTVLGICMIIRPEFFVAVIAYLFAAILVLYGIYHIIIVAYLNRRADLPWIFYIIPALLVASGTVILCTSVHTMNSIATLVTGIMLLAVSANWMLQRLTLYNVARRKPAPAIESSDTGIKLIEDTDV